MAKDAGGSKAQLLSTLASQAVDSLSGTHYAIADALDHVASKPGLYAVYADPKTWQELNLEVDSPAEAVEHARKFALLVGSERVDVRRVVEAEDLQ